MFSKKRLLEGEEVTCLAKVFEGEEGKKGKVFRGNGVLVWPLISVWLGLGVFVLAKEECFRRRGRLFSN